MPTISESPYWALREKREAAVQDFVAASPGTVRDSVDVLRARLWGFGLRGDELTHEVKSAQLRQLTQRRSHTLRIHQPLWGGFPKMWAVGEPGSITWTEDWSKAGKYTLQECGTLREQLRTAAPNAVVEIDGM